MCWLTPAPPAPPGCAAGVRDRIVAAAKLCGAGAIRRGGAYPGWAPNPASPLLQLTRETYQEALGREPKAGSAAFECGAACQAALTRPGQQPQVLCAWSPGSASCSAMVA
jgi:hypothetical protein